MYTRNLLDQVRVKGKVGIPKGESVCDCFPIIYEGEANDGVPYYTSGGRSLLIEEGHRVYKLGGVDPHGHLTKRVALSPQNRLSDVRSANEIFEMTGHNSKKMFGQKPFGVYTLENCRHAKTAFERLNDSYQLAEINPPCRLVDYRHIGGIDDNIYQLLFELPLLESDLRVSELLDLIEKKLENASQKELQEKVIFVNRLCGRLVAWMGYTMTILAQNLLVPTQSSWVDQNVVFHHIGNGYGAFRVDHTSTTYNDSKSVAAFRSYIERNFDDPLFHGFQFSFLTEAAQLGALEPEGVDKLPGTGTTFKRVMSYYKASQNPQHALVDITPLVTAHRNVFRMGCEAAGRREWIHSMAIPEEYLKTIFD